MLCITFLDEIYFRGRHLLKDNCIKKELSECMTIKNMIIKPNFWSLNANKNQSHINDCISAFEIKYH